MAVLPPGPSRWRSLDRRVRYLLVGGWNSLVAYACFACAWFLLGDRLPASAVVVVGYIAASFNGYVSFRALVFTSAGDGVREYLRYQAVYLPILALNAIALPVGIVLTKISPYVLQALFAGVGVVLAYAGNRAFVFRGRP